MKQNIAYLFPGQGSQAIGMGKDLADAYPTARQVFIEADNVLGFPLSSLAWEGPSTELDDTINTQPALLVHSIAVLRIIQESYPEIKPVFVAGHSMGELSALVGAGALDFPNALKLARRRGELMKQAGDLNPGAMAAIFGLDIQTLEKICADASCPGETVGVANDNCPAQVVISGSTPALERAIQLAAEQGARRAKALAVSIAAHSPLMAHAQSEFITAIHATPIVDPSISLVGNVTALPLSNASQIRADLQAQLTSRVRWTETIQFMVNQGVSHFIEIGSGSVLTGLLKRITDQATGYAIGNPTDLDKLSAL